MVTVYLSGPISYMKNDNEEAFRKIEKELKQYGINSVVPHDLFTMDEKERFTQQQFLKRCVAHMAQCDLVITLDQWQISEGAQVEVDVARRLWMEVLHYVKIPAWIIKNEFDRKEEAA